MSQYSRGGYSGFSRGGRGQPRGGRGRGTFTRDLRAALPSSTQQSFFTNAFPIKINSPTTTPIFKYHAEFVCPTDNIERLTDLKIRLLTRHRAVLPQVYVFDGAILFSPDPDVTQETLRSYLSTRPVDIKLRKVGQVNPTDAEFIQLVSLIFKNVLQQLGFQKLQKTFCDPETVHSIPEYKLQVISGFEVTFRQHENNELFLTPDVSNRVLRIETVLEHLRQACRRGGITLAAAGNALVGQIIMTPYNMKTYQIISLDTERTPEHTFVLEKTKEEISYSHYIGITYNRPTHDKRQPLLVCRPKERSKKRAVIIIPEHAQLTGLTQEQRQNSRLMQALSDHTRPMADDRARTLLRFAQRLQQNPSTNQILDSWNLKLPPATLTALEGSQMPLQRILLHESTCDAVGLSQALKNNAFATGYHASLAFLYLEDNAIASHQFQNSLLRLAQYKGGNLSFVSEFGVKQLRDMPRILPNLQRMQHVDIVLVVIPSYHRETYEEVKKVATLECALLTQVVCLDKVVPGRTRTPGVLLNILTQLMAKTGFAPWKITIPLKNVMTVGFDVFHQKQYDSILKPSVGAFVSSLNQAGTRYFTNCTEHCNGEEISHFFERNIQDALCQYHDNNGNYPSYVVFYRDGVGEGQLEHVQTIEIDALTSVLRPREIQLIYIVVTKRLATRFFQRDLQGNFENPSHGLLVNSGVTSPSKNDFYIVSQSPTRGTVSPVHYSVLLDEAKLGRKRIQTLTYLQMFLYFNSTSQIKVPSLIQYAHKAAAFMGDYISQNPASPQIKQQLYYI